MTQCCQCDRIAIFRLRGNPLCVYCLSRYQQASAESQNANNQSLALLAAMMNFEIESMAAMAGLRSSWPQIQIPQPIRAVIQGGVRLNNIINIDRSVIGMLNAGQVRDVQSISINVSSLAESGQTEVAEALKLLTEAVAAEKNIAEELRTELLDQINELSNQAGLVPRARRLGIIKSVLAGLVTSLTAAGSLAQLWSVCGDAICKYFGVENPFKAHH